MILACDVVRLRSSGSVGARKVGDREDICVTKNWIQMTKQYQERVRVQVGKTTKRKSTGLMDGRDVVHIAEWERGVSSL